MSDAFVILRELRFRHRGGPFEMTVPDLAIARGEAVACVGPSGCGKTTLLELMVGIRRPDAGRIEIDGIRLDAMTDTALRRWRRREVGLVFQDLRLLDSLTALENILLPYHLDGSLGDLAAATARARRLAESMGIDALLRRRPRRLSQGERQRIAVCRALVTEPALVAADEPTGSLDPDTAAVAADLLVEAARRGGRTLFMVTHDHSLLDRFDRVVEMRSLLAAEASS
ncbi:MAG: ABC transporter ATP-binding protein [Phycisphaerales bacterium]|jgi:putative ABC transport system ATP-binding protein